MFHHGIPSLNKLILKEDSEQLTFCFCGLAWCTLGHVNFATPRNKALLLQALSFVYVSLGFPK